MRLLFLVPGKNVERVKDIIGIGNNSVSKRTFIIRTKKELSLGGEGFYFALVTRPNDKTLELLRTIVSKVAREASDEEKSNVVYAIKKAATEEEPAPKGDLAIFELLDINKARNMLGIGTESVERQTLIFKDAAQFGKEKGQILLIDGNEGACTLAKELLGDLCTEITGAEKEAIVKKIYDEEQSAFEGFGGIFG